MTKKTYCKQPKVLPTVFASNVSEIRKGFLLGGGKKWVNGTVITYYFIDGPEPQRAIVRQAFQQWMNLGIGISFAEVSTREESIARIAFVDNDGSWSYVGRDNLNIPKTETTMNFGWDLTENAYGMTTALHEIGHLIGFQHEHQSPFSGIEWDTEAVYAEFSGYPNYWSKESIDSNILTKLPPNQVVGSTWDPKSIMEYEFGPGLVRKPITYSNGIFPPGILSANDIKGVKSFYPTLSAPSQIQTHKSMVIKAKSGKQDDFVFVPDATRKYTFQTVGELDTVMVISEKGETENYYLEGNDDSGTDANAKITLPLVKGRKYLVNIKVVYAPNPKSGSLIIT